MYPALGTVRQVLSEIPVLANLFGEESAAKVFDTVFVIDYRANLAADDISSEFWLAIGGEIALALPGLNGTTIVLGGGAIEGYTFFSIFAKFAPELTLAIRDLELSLRFDPRLLRPALLDGADAPNADVRIALKGSLEIDGALNIRVLGFDRVALSPAMIGRTGVIIAADDVKFDLSRNRSLPEVIAAGYDDSFLGVFIGAARMKLPAGLPALAPEDLVLNRCAIGSGGVSGALSAHYSPVFDSATREFTGPGSGQLFGVPFGLASVEVEFKQNCLVRSALIGDLFLPFFDARITLDIASDASGSVSVTVASSGSDPIKPIKKDGLLEFAISSLATGTQDGRPCVKLSGKLTPRFGEPTLRWPSFDVRELSIDSHGNVKLDGGWLDLPTQYYLDLYGFHLEITQLGFGKNDDGSKWIGFSGSLHLIDGVQAGASVEGLRIISHPDGSVNLTFRGIGVEFEVPGVLRFKGAVSKSETKEEFSGPIKVDLLALGIEVDGIVVFGNQNGTKYGAIYLACELPTGIALPTGGVSIYGFAGLFAFHMEPGRRESEAWYRNPDNSAGWYLRNPEGLTDLPTKWRPAAGSFALGCGVTLGTTADNGYAFAGKFLLAVVFPGPILFLEGRANILKPRAQLTSGEDPMFKALAVLDFRKNEFTLGLDARYRQDSGGRLIDIRAGAEVYFNLADPSKWHLYIGKDQPMEARIRASVLQLFDANSYFMLEPTNLRLGVWIGFSKQWNFGVGSVALESWIEGNAAISWKPTHFHGDIWLHGRVSVDVLGFGFGLTADATLAVDAFNPYHILARLTVAVDLPWPFDDWDVDLTLEWGSDAGYPSIEPPLQEVSVEHFKATTVWRPPDAFSVSAIPTVPLDARPRLSFRRPVHDDALIGVNAQPLNPDYEQIGDPVTHRGPASVRYGIKSVRLQKLNGTSWIDVASRAAGKGDLYGSWAPVPALPTGQPASGASLPMANQKLWLWSKTPFDYGLNSGPSYADWMSKSVKGYPCDAANQSPTFTKFCVDFESVDPRLRLCSPYQWPDHPEVMLTWPEPEVTSVAVLQTPGIKLTKALCLSSVPMIETGQGGYRPKILFSDAANNVTITTRTDDLEFQFTGPSPTPPLFFFPAVFFVWQSSGQQPETVEPDGITCSGNLEIEFSPPVDFAALKVRVTSDPSAPGQTTAKVEAVNDGGVNIPVSPAQLSSSESAWTVIVSAPRIQTIRVKPLYQALVDRPFGKVFLTGLRWSPKVYAIAVGLNGEIVSQFAVSTGQTIVPGSDLRVIEFETWPGAICISQICAAVGPSQQQVQELTNTKNNLAGSGAFWSRKGEVLEPYTDYRLAVETTATGNHTNPGSISPTTFAYFRTSGPPGIGSLSSPADPAKDFDKDNPFTDLARYVVQTIPPTVPRRGDKPELPRPVYRAYDVSVNFNEDYVDLMYLIMGRDLGLYLFDNNGRPVRQAGGRLITAHTKWLDGPSALSRTEAEWVRQLNGAGPCVPPLPPVPPKKRLQRAVPGQLLNADTVYEARLTPLLLNDGWTASSYVSDWTGVEFGLTGSKWDRDTKDPGVVQTAPVFSPSTVVNTVAAGALLIRGKSLGPSGSGPYPYDWTDYAVTVAASAVAGSIGLVFRYSSTAQHYRFVLDGQANRRRLIAVTAGAPRLLAEDVFALEFGKQYELTVECAGTDIRAYQDGALIFALNHAGSPKGTIGLYSSGHQGARFGPVKVDDYAAAAPVAYKFQFTSSLHANFAHHLHSYPDGSWPQPAPQTFDPGRYASAMVIPQAPKTLGPVPENEWRAYNNIIGECFGPVPRQLPKTVETTRLISNGTTLGLLLESPEPIDWSRTELGFAALSGPVDGAVPPGSAKMIAAELSASSPAQESVTVLARDTANLAGSRIEFKTFPGPLEPETGDPIVFLDNADSGPRGTLFRQRQTSDALDWYEISQESGSSSTAAFSINGTAVRVAVSQGAPATSPAGIVALPRSVASMDVRLVATVKASSDTVGLVFRYVDEKNCLRFSMSRGTDTRRRLIKQSGAASVVLWEDAGAYDLSQDQSIRIEAVGSRIVGYVNNVFLLSVEDNGPVSGRAGLYFQGNLTADVIDFLWDEPPAPLVLAQPPFTDRSQLVFLPVPDSLDLVGEWTVSTGKVNHAASNGTVRRLALISSTAFDTVRFSCRLSQSAGQSSAAAGLLCRYADDDNYSIVSIDAPVAGSVAPRVVRYLNRVAGVETEVWKQPLPSPTAVTEVTLCWTAGHLQAAVNGTVLNEWTGLSAVGRAGIWCDAGADASFERCLIANNARIAGPWHLVEPSPFVMATSLAKGTGALLASGPGGFALAGESEWQDCRIRANLESLDGTPGLAFRYRDENNFYLALWKPGTLSVTKVKAGQTSVVAQTAVSGDLRHGAEVALDLVGSRIRLYWKSKLLVDAVDADVASGRVGVYLGQTSRLSIRDFEIRRVPREARALLRSRFEVGDVGGWSFTPATLWTVSAGMLRAGAGTALATAGNPAWKDVVVVARWKPLSSASAGVVFRYQDANNHYRFLLARGDFRLEKVRGGVATAIWTGDAIPFGVLTARPTIEIAVVVKGPTIAVYLDGASVAVVQDPDLPAGAVGFYSDGTAANEFHSLQVYPDSAIWDKWDVADPFTTLDPKRWDLVDPQPIANAPAWSAAKSALVHSGPVNAPPTGPAAPRFAVLSDPAFADFRLSVSLRLDNQREAGFVFNYTDAKNFWFVRIHPGASQVSIYSWTAGVETRLAVASRRISTANDVQLTLDRIGTQVRVCLNGTRVFDYLLEQPSAGRIGLYCTDKSAVRFSNFRVARPVWQRFAAFGAAPDLQPGEQRVIVGSAPGAVGDSPRTSYAAALEDSGRVCFSSSPVQIRLVERSGEVVHQRPFQPSSAYVDTRMGVIRNADGTGLFLFPRPAPVAPNSAIVASAGPAPPPVLSRGLYRLNLSYHRTPVAPWTDSPVLSEAGDTGIERVSIDIPV